MHKANIYPISKVNPEDTKMELCCAVAKMVLAYFRDQYGQAELEQFIFRSKMNIDYLESRNNWMSFSYFCRLLNGLRVSPTSTSCR